MGTQRSQYDEDVLVADLAYGEMTQKAIAEKHGLSEIFVGQLSRGERRPELQARIEAVNEGMLEQTRRLGKRLAATAMARLGSLVAASSKAPEEVQRKASMDILAHALGDPSKPDQSVNVHQSNGPDLAGLTDDTKAAVLKELGGPADDPGQAG